MNDSQLDFSIQEMPQAWIDASADAPKGDNTPLKKKSKNLGTMGRPKLDPFGAAVGAIGPAVVGGAAWYYVDAAGAVESPWTPVLFGAVIGLGVRLGGGRPEPSQRATIAAFVYVMAIMLVLFAIHRTHVASYLPVYDWGDIERSVLRGYLSDGKNALGLLLGAVAAVGLNLATRLRG